MPDAQSSEPDEWQEGEMRRKEAVVAQCSQTWLMKPPCRTRETFLSAATPHLAQRQVPPPSFSEPPHQPNLLNFVPLQDCKGESWLICCLQAGGCFWLLPWVLQTGQWGSPERPDPSSLRGVKLDEDQLGWGRKLSASALTSAMHLLFPSPASISPSRGRS